MRIGNVAWAAVAALTGVLTLPGLAPAAPQLGLLDAVTRTQHYEARRESSSHEDITRNGDAEFIGAGDTLTLADVEGPGVVVQMWITISTKDPFPGRSHVLRIYYDGNEHPSVQTPLGDFFGLGYGAFANYTSAVTNVASHGRSWSMYWRIPFKESMRMTVTNESDTYDTGSFYYHLNWHKHDSLPEDTTYFHGYYRQEHPSNTDFYKVLEVEGRGHYVGTVYSAVQMETGWYGEGDDFFWIDGADHPQLKGTGTEEYVLDAWGFRPFHTPYGGVPVYEGVLPGDVVSVYRWHLPDPIPFKTSLRFEMEHKGSIFNEEGTALEMELGGFESRYDWLSSLALWYQYPPVELTEPLPPVEERMPPYTVIRPGDGDFRANPPFLIMPDDGALNYAPNRPDAELEVDFTVEEAGRYRLRGRFFHSLMSGKYKVFLNDKPLGKPLDFVIINADLVWVDLDNHDLKEGVNTLRFKGVAEGRAPLRTMAPQFFVLGFEQLVLTRLDTMEGYKQGMEEVLEKRRR